MSDRGSGLRSAIRRMWWLAALAAVSLLLSPPAVGNVYAEERWVQAHKPPMLWSSAGPDAEAFGRERKFSYFRVHGEQVGGRLYVWNPRTDNFAWVDADAVGPSTPPPPGYLALARPNVLETIDVPARAIGTASVWQEPIRDDDIWVRDVPHNGPLHLEALVEGDEGEHWYRLDDGTYVPADQVRLPPASVPHAGKWIDVMLSAPTLVTAYENGKPIYSAMAIHGVGGWETPIGRFAVQYRVANERMRGPGYDVPNVLFTQYFTGAGHSIHYNYWSSNWGYAGSHGCLGMNYEDALWFWNWATIGTTIDIHW